jgi:crotonobetainyl-CoA:carnitine CoA-transferase CaiB-like acyl-CoA transferase
MPGSGALPLSGVRVVEMAAFLGDQVGMLLGDLGADVVKVEQPGRGDHLRDSLGQLAEHYSPAHVQVNRNKRSVTIDVADDRGRDVFWDLLRTADVFVDGLGLGVCDGLGIGYDAQRAVRPDVVYCRHSPFGAAGPYAGIPAHSPMLRAVAGAFAVRTDAEGFVRPIFHAGGSGQAGEATATGGAFAALEVVSALVARERGAGGCLIDSSAADAVVASAAIGLIAPLNAERLRERTGLEVAGDGTPLGVRYQFYETADRRYVLLACLEPSLWRRFCAAVGHPEWQPAAGAPVAAEPTAGRAAAAGQADPTTGRTMTDDRDDDLRRRLQAIFHTRAQAEWVELAASERFALAPVNGTDDLRSDPQLRTRPVLWEDHHPATGPFTYVGPTAVVDGRPPWLRRYAPALGEHTDEVLAELGYTADRLDGLRRAGVI